MKFPCSATRRFNVIFYSAEMAHKKTRLAKKPARVGKEYSETKKYFPETANSPPATLPAKYTYTKTYTPHRK
jgi:hypothetical protein